MFNYQNMNPSFAIPTDNIFKFACLFGLALVVVSVFAFVATYNFTLENKARYSETIIFLESKSPRTKADEDILKLNERLLNVISENGNTANTAIGLLCGVGISISFLGAISWYRRVQQRDDELVKMQMEKLHLEIANLKRGNQMQRYRRAQRR